MRRPRRNRWGLPVRCKETYPSQAERQALAKELAAILYYDIAHRMLTEDEKKKAHALIDQGADLSDNGMMLLHSAVMLDDASLVRHMIEKKADINARDKNNKTPLIAAAAWKGDDVIAEILKAAPDPFLFDRNGRTAIDIATSFQRSAETKALIRQAEKIYADKRASLERQAEYHKCGLPLAADVRRRRIASAWKR